MKRHGIIVRPSSGLGAAFNPGAAHIDGRFYLLARSVPKGYQKIGNVNEFDDNYNSHLSLWSGTSPKQFELVRENALMPDAPFDKYGVEDPRICKLGDTYYVLYTSIAIGLGQPDAHKGIRIALASTKDFKTFKKHGVIGPDRRSKAGTLFSAGGKAYFMWKDEQDVERTMITPAPTDIENPKAWSKMWKARDIEQDVLLAPQNNAHENFGVEPGAPPIEIDAGLLTVYSSISRDNHWTISLMLLDKNDPRKIISKTNGPVLSPLRKYEREGDVPNVVFPCGALIHDKRLYVYYGAADTVCAVASMSLTSVKKALKPNAPPAPRP